MGSEGKKLPKFLETEVSHTWSQSKLNSLALLTAVNLSVNVKQIFYIFHIFFP